MTATLHTFPQHRVVRLALNPRMTEGDLETLRQRWPTGRHETVITDDPHVVVDRWHVPGFDDGDLWITLEPNGDWSVIDAGGDLVKKAASVEAL